MADAMEAGGGGSDAARSREVTFDLNGLLSTQDALTVKVATQANWLQSTSKAVAGDNTGVMYLGAAIALAWLVRCCFGGQENQEEGKLEQRLAGVVEIGCGHGLCGALARKLLPTTVPCVLTDGNERALDLARGTVEANGFTDERASRCHVRRLRWGNSDDVEAVVDLVRKGEGLGVLVLAADLVYAGIDYGALFSTISHLISARRDGGGGGCCVFSFSPRELDWERKVVAAMQENGFACVFLDETLGRVGVPHEIRGSTTTVVNCIFGPADQSALLSECSLRVPEPKVEMREWLRRVEEESKREEDGGFLSNTADDCFS